MALAAPAAAQVAGTVTLENDYQWRGYSISAGKPAAVLDLSYDAPSGFYLNGSAAGTLDHDNDPVPLAVIGNAGYARRLSPRVSVDAGVTRAEYFETFGYSGTTGYTEIYAGFAARGVSSHLYYSPDYFGHGTSTLYGEVEGGIEPIPKLRLSAHVGVLGYLSAPAGFGERETEYDWRLTASRKIGHVDLHASVSSGGPGEDYYDGETHGRTAVVVGASWTF